MRKTNRKRLSPIDYQKDKLSYHLNRLQELGMTKDEILKFVQSNLNIKQEIKN